MDYFIIENEFGVLDNFVKHGEANGYVIIPFESVFWGIDYNSGLLPGVHGGWTYGKKIRDMNQNSLIYKKAMEMGAGGDEYILGFDTYHYGDDNIERCKKAVEDHIKSRAELLSKLEIEYKKVYDSIAD